MIRSESTEKRSCPLVILEAGLIVTGGGLSGICCAVTAAREGLKVVLVQDRSVLGGNASSEIRLWILGATSHMGNNNRWAREGGVVDEILVENTYRNPEGNPVILDSILLDKVTAEPNITLLLNTVVYHVEKKDAETISSLKAFCSQNQTTYELRASLFCDASGDGVVGFLSGAAFRMGAEPMEEFNELFAPSKSYGELLGHSLYFYSKDTGKPVRFVPPSFALMDITEIPKFKSFNAQEFGCKLWWIEYGGRMDTVHDTEKIKWELWKIVYGVWNYIKNSGNFPEAETLTLEWVGMIPGKRESRRFEGDYILKQQDVIEQRMHNDAVAFGGWSLDLHPSDGVYSAQPGCTQWHSKGVYQIPYRCLYSKNIKNLFLAGRIISASHVAFGSSRVMATSAYVAQVAGMAAVLCTEKSVVPATVDVPLLQERLAGSGQYIPFFSYKDSKDLVQTATIKASSELALDGLEEDSEPEPLEIAVAQMLPVQTGSLPVFGLNAYCDVPATLLAEIRICSRRGSYTPDTSLVSFEFNLVPGKNNIQLANDLVITEGQYIFVLLHKNPLVRVSRSFKRITGILSVFNTINPAVSNYGKQAAPAGIGIDSFEFWVAQRRPAGQNIALSLDRPLTDFGAENIRNGTARPTTQANAWVAALSDKAPTLTLTWNEKKPVRKLILSFDTDFDHPMESVLMTHPENVMVFCVRDYIIYDDAGEAIYEKKGNYQTRNVIIFPEPVNTSSLSIRFTHPSEHTPAAVFEVRAY
ncbi:FAD-dependent oxidoreductase [Chitinophaga sancti]|uniref:FAD-dependent oxidoreductase n=1 Tax=Chitinophaga sancti TaxID=1004 RepID=A0A1K1MUI2_9BACT|nr:FAD-dependent oxidoreductase [Chitinophaga sancti]WQD63000.1 FAD-dependent oxidoreductase [Chitinophaga sancti]WQG91375.1 FAD-dependent oxidoreductase [Chitinophaga sancti]SFW26751.1 FAD dependent oxidoreductase [Chitinophaga sancti]